jgi:hypothetical protein
MVYLISLIRFIQMHDVLYDAPEHASLEELEELADM